MAFLTPDEIKTHLYSEIVSMVDRADNTVLQSAIDAAISEVKSYLSAFDTDAIFSSEGDDRNPILLLYTKDISVWHFIQLANPNTNLELRADRYEKAIAWLDKVMRGQVVPDLPMPAPPTDGDQNNFIKWGANAPRNSYF